MSNRLILFVAFVAGIWSLATSSSPIAAALGSPQLIEYQGGEKWCAQAIIDQPGIDCNECVAGFSTSNQCNTTNRDETWEYVPGQKPAVAVDHTEKDCTGTQWWYSASTECKGAFTSTTCSRKYDYWGTVMFDKTGTINCP